MTVTGWGKKFERERYWKNSKEKEGNERDKWSKFGRNIYYDLAPSKVQIMLSIIHMCIAYSCTLITRLLLCTFWSIQFRPYDDGIYKTVFHNTRRYRYWKNDSSDGLLVQYVQCLYENQIILLLNHFNQWSHSWEFRFILSVRVYWHSD